MWQHTYQHTTDASPEQLWATITDIESWSSWDSEIESTKLDAPLALGSSFTLKPKGGPRVKLTVEELSSPQRFVDLSHLPLGKMRTIHEFLPTARGTQITVTLQIYGVLGFLWRKVIGEKQAKGLADQTAHFIANAKSPITVPPNHALQRTEAGGRVFSEYRIRPRQPLSLSLEALGGMARVFLFLVLSVAVAAAQTWYTGDPSRIPQIAVDNDFLVTRVPIKVLEPPKLARMKVSWDRVTAHWTINLESNGILDSVYKPCSFTFADFSGYTVRAGDRDGRTVLMLVPSSYEQAITLRDALIRLHGLPPENVSTESKDAEKHLE